MGLRPTETDENGREWRASALAWNGGARTALDERRAVFQGSDHRRCRCRRFSFVPNLRRSAASCP